MHDGLKAAGGHPAAHLLVHERPRRQIVGHQAPVRAGLDDVAHAVEDLAQVVLALAASSRNKVKYGATKTHSSSLTSVG